ncbi:MAG TPA: MerR family transcriptional regulator [Saprospiraceae bacterium]|nr:MerR family transcriptional regulator [Saprospiraceae bacterium]
MGIYSISDLAEITGIKCHTLRVWEKRYGLLKPRRTDSNIRYYQDEDLDVLKQVVHLHQHGVKISRIAEMSTAEMEEESRRMAITDDNQEERLQQGMMDMNVPLMDSVLDDAIRKNGFEWTLMSLILPTLEKMEMLWLSGTIDEAHEACFRQLIKQKTIREIDQLPNNQRGPRVIMFLPQGNQQELSHLFMHYFLRRQGLCVTDMGCEINLDCACSALQKCEAECVLIVNADPVHWQFGPYVRNLVSRTSLPIIVSGRATEDQWSQYGGQVIILDGIEETIRFVSRLKENLQNLIS